MLRISQKKKPPRGGYTSEVLKLFFISTTQIQIKSSAQKKDGDSLDTL